MNAECKLPLTPLVTFCAFAYVRESRATRRAYGRRLCVSRLVWIGFTSPITNCTIASSVFRILPRRPVSSSRHVGDEAASLSPDPVCFKLASVDNQIASSFIVNVLFFTRWNGNKWTTMGWRSDVTARLMRGVKWTTIRKSKRLWNARKSATRIITINIY